MANYIYRATIVNDGETIHYHNSKGQKVTYQPQEDRDSEFYEKRYQGYAKTLFSAINKYFTGDSPNITPQEQVKLRADIAKQVAPIINEESPKGTYKALNIYEGIDFVLKTFSDKASDGGENITPNEVYQIYEIFHSWTK